MFFDPALGWVLLGLAFVLGLVMGSGMNCLAMRYVDGNTWNGRSCCPFCFHVLSPGELIPVLSWVMLGGRCRHCGAPISKRYPLTELAMGAIYMSVAARFGVTWDTVSVLVLVTCLFCLSLIDLETLEIPNTALIIPAAVRLVLLVVEHGFSLPLWQNVWPALALGGSVLVLSLLMDKVLGRESMGGGDIKLLFMLGLFMNFPCCILLIIVSCIVGLAMAFTLGVRKGAFPFGPAIALAAWIVLMIGEPVTAWYLGLF